MRKARNNVKRTEIQYNSFIQIKYTYFSIKIYFFNEYTFIIYFIIYFFIENYLIYCNICSLL